MAYEELEIPDFLKRELTPEVMARIKRATARAVRRHIKNPPKRVSKRRASGLGAAFGVKIVER